MILHWVNDNIGSILLAGNELGWIVAGNQEWRSLNFRRRQRQGRLDHRLVAIGSLPKVSKTPKRPTFQVDDTQQLVGHVFACLGRLGHHLALICIQSARKLLPVT
jgi:hypothetical protein